MRNLTKTLSYVSMLLPLAACAINPTSSAPPAETLEKVQSALARVQDPALSPAEQRLMIDGNSAFAVELFQRATSAKPNAVVSPHSISMALAMTYAGANGTTKSEIAKALHFGLVDADLHRGFNWLDQLIASRATNLMGKDGKSGRIAVNNALFSQRGFAINAPFVDVLGSNYGAPLYLADFTRDPVKSTHDINAWVSEKTEGKIEQLLAVLPPATRLVLINTVFVNGAWLRGFDRSVTQPAPFRVGSAAVMVPMMRSEHSAQRYGESADAVVAELTRQPKSWARLRACLRRRTTQNLIGRL
jgi:serpin B